MRCLLNSFLSSNEDKAVIILGNKSSENVIYDIAKVKLFSELIIIYKEKALINKIKKLLEKNKDEIYVPQKIDYILFEEIYNLSNLSNYVLLFDSLNSSDEFEKISFLECKSKFGSVDKRKINSFEIWECLREKSEKLYIVSYGAGREVLSWKKPKSGIELSVIFPVYNVANYLEKCIETVTAWKAPYIEFLFVNDGSPDNSAEIIEKYSVIDPRIKLLNKVNGGCASARQYGLDRAKGQYIGFIDPDDFVDPTMFEKLFSKAIQGSYEISYCGYNEYYENTGRFKPAADSIFLPYSQGCYNNNAINNLISYLQIAIWRGIYSKDLIDRSNISFYTDLRRFDDLPFKVEVYSKARSVVSTPEYLYFYRLSRPGQDVAADDERLYVHFQIFKYLDEFIRKSSDQRQLDYLQYVKLQTHLWGIKKIKNKCLSEYLINTRKDLKSNFGYFESLYILSKLGKKRDCLLYTLIYLGLGRFIKHINLERGLSKKEINRLNILKDLK